MRWNFVFNIIGILTIFLGFSMMLALGCSVYYQDDSISSISISIGITLIAGLLLYLIFKTPKTEFISHREGMAIVAIGWTTIGFFGALPFFFGDLGTSFVDAFFESVSGFTTTGASILTEIESVPKGLLFWRSFIQWLGGMGIIVLSIAILPFLGVGGMQLYKAEVPSPVPDKLKPRIKDTAKILWQVYIFFTIIGAVLLMFGGFDLFDALCHMFTTMPTGGFSTKNTSIAYYNSVYTDIIIIIFMVFAGINFSLYYQFFKGKDPMLFWKDTECRFYLGTVLILSVIITIDVYKDVYPQLGKAVQYASFQVVSILTTTGFATADYEKWPAMSQFILLLCMFLGASAGSTGGGMKCLRIMLCLKFCYKELFSLIHPRAVKQIKIGGKAVSDDVIRSILGFLALYMILFAISSVLLASLGVDVTTSFSAVAATIGNIGPGFGMVGPVDNYAAIPYLGKWLLIWCMLLGRLEIYTVIILLVPEFWKK